MVDLLTFKEVAKILGIPVPGVQKLRREGKLNATKVGKEFRVLKSDLDQYLGITSTTGDMQRELYIKELENENKHLRFVLNSVKNNLNNINFVIGEG